VQLDKIKVFEENNKSYGVNVYGYKEECVYPLRISENEDREKTLNLLMISNSETHHYCWIKGMSRLCTKQTTKRNGQRYFCERCLNSFKTSESLEKHMRYCKNHEAIKITLPKKGTLLQFKNYNNSMRVPFVIYADFECFTEGIDSCRPDSTEAYTEKYQKHKPSGYCYLIVKDDGSVPEMVRYTSKEEGEDIGQLFVDALEKSIKGLVEERKRVKMMGGDRELYRDATLCHICNKELNEDKVSGPQSFDWSISWCCTQCLQLEL